ncbi:MAG: protein-glutamate O-methyltransferase CheR [Bryobacteraceae bacterium]
MATSAVELSSGEFEQIRRLARERFGLDLRPGKESLVAARLGKRVREQRFSSFRDYFRHVLDDRTGEALTGMIDALVTNYTSFFREPAHFEFLRALAQDWQPRRARVWCAACATGEEAYSLAFVLAGGAFELLATDISTRALQAARRGVYGADRLAEVPEPLRHRFFVRCSGPDQGQYQVRPEIRAQVDFRRINLIESFESLGGMTVIFCRNVMIYFDKATQQDLVERLAQRLEPGGYLFVGHSESLTGVRHGLEYVRPAVYRKRGGRCAM